MQSLVEPLSEQKYVMFFNEIHCRKHVTRLLCHNFWRLQNSIHEEAQKSRTWSEYEKKQMQKVFLIKIQKSNERINSFLVTKRLFLFRFVFKVSQLWWQTSSFKFSFSSPKFSFLFGLASPRPNDRRRRIWLAS
jgi:hypothetical protein